MRHSGKTFRHVLRAMADASEGQHVIYISDTFPHLEHARLIGERCVIGNKHVKIMHNKICFCDGEAGCVEFLTEAMHVQREQSKMYAGMPHPHFVFDLT